MSFGKTEIGNSDRIYEGLRIPSSLKNVTSVSFVLTQEPGKLKPKDLKVAIEKNRAEKELRAEEQRKLREEGGGAGLLDLRGILAEERLNASPGDPFKRQLREMAFLADIDDVEKLEIEKGFRISEDYLGSSLLSKRDLELVIKQRKAANLHKKRSQWQIIQSRNLTKHYHPSHLTVKAGTFGHRMKAIIQTSIPHFDSNRNDLWGKRINSLRRLISLTSRWLIRKRVKDRMDIVMKYFHDNQCFTRKEIRDFINNQAQSASSGASSESNSSDKKKLIASKQLQDDADDLSSKNVTSVSMIAFARENEAVATREHNKRIINQTNEKIRRGENEITPNMVRRILFPRCNPPQGGGVSSEQLKEPLLDAPIYFDDRSLYQLKVKPDYVTLGYEPFPIPLAPIHVPALVDKPLRLGAPEEETLRAACDDNVTDIDILQWVPIEEKENDSHVLKSLREPNVPKPRNTEDDYLILEESDEEIRKKEYLKPIIPNKSESASESSVILSKTMPRWLTHSEDTWTASELNFFDPVPSLRIHGAASCGPRRCEIDVDWPLRPGSEQLVYEPDSSIRTKWLSMPGFASANSYLLGGHDSLNRDPPPSTPGPTLADFYLPDTDRHLSGLSFFAIDHLRSATEKDHDVKPLQHKQDKRDYLTESESDDEDAYGHDYKPTMERVRLLLKPPPPKVVEPVATEKGGGKKGGAPAKGSKPATTTVAAATTTTTATTAANLDSTLDSFSMLLGEDQRKEEQVELLSDRKILEMESTLQKMRRAREDEFTNRMIEISKQTKCSVKAMKVQQSFYLYEDEVYRLTEKRMPALKSSH